MTYFLFKDRVEDFVVEEVLEQEPSGKGDFHYIFIEKKGLATFELLHKLHDEFGFNRNMVGIAGLKDKQGVTSQWLSFPKRDVQKLCGGVNNLLTFLRKNCKVLNATYGERLLKLGMNKGNKFTIMLRLRTKKDHVRIAPVIDGILNEMKEGIPNYFGEQRFGHRGRNWETGRMLLQGEIRSLKGDINTMAEKRFKVQAFASYMFNKYLDMRWEQHGLDTLLPGDVISAADGYVFHKEGEKPNKEKLAVTGPVRGYDLLKAKEVAGKLEDDMSRQSGVSKREEAGFQKFQVFGIRRPIIIYPADLTRKRTKDKNLLINLTLPSGSYASVFVEYLEKILKHALTGK